MKKEIFKLKVLLPIANSLLLLASCAAPAAFAAEAGAKSDAPTAPGAAPFTEATDPTSPEVKGSNSEALKKAIEAVKSDVVMRAMGDELDRSMKNLRLPNYPLPYYGSYYVTDEEFIQITGSFGALSNKDSAKSRHCEVNLRVGDEKLDNTTMSGGMGLFGGYSLLVRDDNYDAIRRDLWTQTDRAYKSAVESLAGAKAQLKYVDVEDRPDSFSYAKPVISLQEGVTLDANIDEWAERMRKLSAVFKEYPAIQDSSVSMNMRARTKRLMNSEGTAVKYGELGTLVTITAAAYCPDGMIVSDYETFPAEHYQDLPDQATMEAAARKLCKSVEALSKARRGTDYQGPVLFEKQAAAELTATMLPSVLCARPDSGLGSGGDDGVKFGKQILSKSLTVLDDPTIKEWQGKPLKSGWIYDYEGVPAQKLTLVDKGILKALCSTRTPSRLTKASNGHCRGGSASPGHLFISSDGKTSLSDLRLKLIDLGKKDELENVLIVRRMTPAYISTGNGSFNPLDLIRALTGGGGGRQGTATLVYKLDLKTGQEELIRGARLKSVPRKNLMTMEAASDDAQPYVVSYPSDRSATTISMVTPSVLLKEVEFAKPPTTTEKPPYLKNPYFDTDK